MQFIRMPNQAMTIANHDSSIDAEVAFRDSRSDLMILIGQEFI